MPRALGLLALLASTVASAQPTWVSSSDPHALRLQFEVGGDGLCSVRVRATHAPGAMIASSPCQLTEPWAPPGSALYLMHWPDLAVTLLPSLTRNVSANTRFAISGNARGEFGSAQVILHDLEQGTQTIVSSSPTGDPADGTVQAPFLSASGAIVVFSNAAQNLPLPYPHPPQLMAWEAGVLAPLPQDRVYVLGASAETRVLALASLGNALALYDRVSGLVEPVCSGVYPTCFRGISPDGRWLAYATPAGSRVLRDRTTGQEAPLPDDDRFADNSVLFDHASQRVMYGAPLGNGRYTAFVRTLADGIDRRVDTGDPGYRQPVPAAFGPGDAIAVTIDGASNLTTTDVIQGDGFEF